MATNDPAIQYIEAWTSKNVHPVPGLSEAFDLTREVARLKAKLIADAMIKGLSTERLESATGDLDDYLTDAYEKVHDPELGFKD